MAHTATVFIDGEAGTTGLGIRQRLEAFPAVTLKSLTGDRRKDPAARQQMMREVDLVVLCLPDDAAKESTRLADELGAQAPKLLDASTAHRVDPDWAYGFPEMTPQQAAKIAASRKVANPGCYPTAAALGIVPLLKAGLVDAQDIIVDAASGISGAGLKKCIPAMRPGCFMPAASAVIENDEVLDASTASASTTTSSSRNVLRLTSRSSTIASTTSLAVTRSPSACTGTMRAAAASASAGSILPLAASLRSASAICCLAASATPIRVSNNRTRWPACAATCAMPAPMAPAPITATSAEGASLIFRRSRADAC